jgi:hypothetical protein
MEGKNRIAVRHRHPHGYHIGNKRRRAATVPLPRAAVPPRRGWARDSRAAPHTQPSTHGNRNFTMTGKWRP